MGIKRVVTLFFALPVLGMVAIGAGVWKPQLVTQTENAPIYITAHFNSSETGLICCIELTITNKTDAPVTIIWDESALVLPNGESSRLIQGELRFIHIGLPQAPTPIAPFSKAKVVVWPVSRIVETWTLPIPLEDGARLRLHLTWQTTRSKESGFWEWSFRYMPTTSIPTTETRTKTWLGVGVLLLDLLTPLAGEPPPVSVSPWAFFGQATDNSFFGFNLLIGVSYRGYFSKIHQGLNFYWGAGTIGFIFPYLELGTAFQSKGIAIEAGLFWVIPYTNLVIQF